MIYDTCNVASDTQIIEEFTDTRLSDVVSIDTDNIRIILHARPFRLMNGTGWIETEIINCEWIDIYRNEQNIPDRFIFKRIKDAQP